MKRPLLPVVPALALAFALMAVPAMARTGLEGSDPAAGAHLAKVAKITLRFSGALQPALSGARLIDRSGTAIPVATAVSMTAITLLPFQLRPGAYHVDWHSVGQDKTRAKGSIAFTVIP
jgi:methionine-rich copper-binding protein CopC